jgi:hypothetical protein
MLKGLFCAHALLPHFCNQQSGDANPRSTEPENHNPLVFQRNTCDVHCRKKRRRSNGCRSLNIVIEGADLVAIARKKTGSIRPGKIFPLQQDMGPALLDHRHKSVHKIVVFLPANTLVAPADIDRILQTLFVVSPHVEQDRQAVLRMDPAEGRVQRHFADRNAHASGPLVAEAKDTFAITHNDAANAVIARVGEDLFDAVPVWIAQEESARLAPDLTKTLAAFPYRWCINNRQQLFNVTRQEGIEKGLIRVLKVAHVTVLFKICGQPVQYLLAALHLVFQRADVWRQQPVEAEDVPLLFRKSRTFVQARIIQQVEP